MRTFKLWLEDDEEIPRFKRLAFEKVQVAIAQVLKRGIHPWQNGQENDSLRVKFVEMINSDSAKLPQLAQFSFCSDLGAERSIYYSPSSGRSSFEETLQRIRECIRFVDNLTYVELLEIAKERLRQAWSHSLARQLLLQTQSGFDEMRSFLKARDAGVKLSGYADIDAYDLGRLLRLEDFEGQDAALIAEGIPVRNFRSAGFPRMVTDERGFLRMTEGIHHFRIVVERSEGYNPEPLTYNCLRTGEAIRFIPELNADRDKRQCAAAFAQSWACDNGRYCFTAPIKALSEMLERQECQIVFSSLNYKTPGKPTTSTGQILPSKTPRYSVGSALSTASTVDAIRSALKRHGISMSGRKEELAEKLANLAVRLYKESQPELDGFFRRHRFVHAAQAVRPDGQPFPVLQGLDLSNVILRMYIIKHLRGNAILDGAYDNDAFDLPSLASGVIERKVTLSGVFLKVE